ncbi:hypothetical protein C1H46_028386 [Malus baccata]|uniref:Uncharacterized protein n=1 Tax=Malus baccata TaxID=106549 RepID=A0A540LHU7_MALBA|nr:hypothetical protein C1H46_028386 [Malus baccata]
MGGRSGPCTPRSEGCRGQAFFFEAEVQKMRVEMASMKRDAEHSLRQEHMELEKLYRELTDLLVGCRMHVQITRIDEAKNDSVLSEKEAWVGWISTFDLFMFFVACNVLSLFVLRFCDLIFHKN